MGNFEKLLRCINARWQYNDPEIQSCFERTDGLSPHSLLQKSIYHTECCKLITHTVNLSLLTNKTQKSCSQSPEEPVEEHSRNTLRSRTEVYSKNACIICQQEGGKLHRVEFLETGSRMLKVAELLPDKSFFVRMNTVPNSRNAVANDVKYPLKCWLSTQRKALKAMPENQEIQEIEDVNRVIADLEIIEIARQNLTGGCILEMNNLNKTYKNLLKNDYEINYKRYLKRLLNETVPGVVFSRPPALRLFEQLYSADCQAKAIETYKNNSDDFTTKL